MIDFGRTLAGLVDIPYLYETDGLDRSRQILNNETSLEELYIHPSDVPRAGILTPDYELAYVGMGHCGEKFHDHVLFDCKKDPLQVNNLFNKDKEYLPNQLKFCQNQSHLTKFCNFDFLLTCREASLP